MTNFVCNPADPAPRGVITSLPVTICIHGAYSRHFNRYEDYVPLRFTGPASK